MSRKKIGLIFWGIAAVGVIAYAIALHFDMEAHDLWVSTWGAIILGNIYFSITPDKEDKN